MTLNKYLQISVHPAISMQIEHSQDQLKVEEMQFQAELFLIKGKTIFVKVYCIVLNNNNDNTNHIL